MSEQSSLTQRTGTDTASAKGKRLHHTLVAVCVLFALALAVVILRLQRLNELPPGLDAGEGANGIDALRVLQGNHAAFFPELLGGREGMVMYLTAFSIFLFGRTEFALRLPTVFIGAGTLFVVFWLGQVLFSGDEGSGRAAPWRGLFIGSAGACMMAVSLSQTIMGRAAFRANLLPFFLSLCLALLWQAWKQWGRGGVSWLRLGLAGVCAGLLPYTYIAARVAPLLFLFLGLSLLLPMPANKTGSCRADSRPMGIAAAIHRVRAEMPKLAAFVGVAGLVAAPILVHFALHPEHILMRSENIWIFSPSISQGNPLGAFLVNVRDHLLAFGIHGDPIWRHSFAGRPMLNKLEALLFWFGVGLAIWRWQCQPAYRLLLLWLCIMILPAVLSKDFVPYTLRMIGVGPAVYLLIGVGMWEAFRFVKQRFTRVSGTVAAVGLGSVLGSLILFQGVNTYRTYFQKWAVAPETYEAYQANWTELARTLDARPPATGTVYLIPGYTWFSVHWWQTSFEYLYQGSTPTRLISVGAFNLAPTIESTLAAIKNISTVKFVDWNYEIDDGGANADDQIVHLLGKYGRYQGSEEGPSFQIRTFADVSLERPWTYYEHLEPPTVHYDGGMTLNGFAWGQGTEQHSSHQPFFLGQGQALWVAMQWQSAPELDVEYSVSLRLQTIEGGVVHQQDAVLRDPNSASTKHWSAGDSVDTLHYLDLPADLAPGEYELRLVVYDFETLKPTVEIGVWEPETTLARLRLTQAQ